MLGFLTHRARLHEYGRPLVAYVRGDTGGCSLPQAFAALNDGTFQGIRRQLRRSGRILSRTPEGLLHIQTDRTTFWAPSGTDWAYVLAEQAVRVYGDGPHRVQRGNVVLDSGARHLALVDADVEALWPVDVPERADRALSQLHEL